MNSVTRIRIMGPRNIPLIPNTSGLITIVDEMTIEEVGTEEITPPSPVKPF